MRERGKERREGGMQKCHNGDRERMYKSKGEEREERVRID